MKTKFFLMLSTVFLACFFMSCSAIGGANMPKDGKYIWASGAGLGSLPRKVELQVTDGSISGSGPVNKWSFNVSSDEIGPIVSTRMAGPPEMMNAEQRMFEALEGSVLSVSNTGHLNFVKDDKLVLEFEPVG